MLNMKLALYLSSAGPLPLSMTNGSGEYPPTTLLFSHLTNATQFLRFLQLLTNVSEVKLF